MKKILRDQILLLAPAITLEAMLDNYSLLQDAKQSQADAFGESFANADGTAGEKIHRAVIREVQ